MFHTFLKNKKQHITDTHTNIALSNEISIDIKFEKKLEDMVGIIIGTWAHVVPGVFVRIGVFMAHFKDRAI